jgi:phage FluMu protein Com
MATCPKCNKYFREPEDERGEHDCPRCGYSREWDDYEIEEGE